MEVKSWEHHFKVGLIAAEEVSLTLLALAFNQNELFAADQRLVETKSYFSIQTVDFIESRDLYFLWHIVWHLVIGVSLISHTISEDKRRVVLHSLYQINSLSVFVISLSTEATDEVTAERAVGHCVTDSVDEWQIGVFGVTPEQNQTSNQWQRIVND